MGFSTVLTYLKSLSIEGNGLLDQSLFPLDVGQVVERVSMVRVHLESRVVAFLSLSNLLRSTRA